MCRKLLYLAISMLAVNASGVSLAAEDYSPAVQALMEVSYIGHAGQDPDPGEPQAVLEKFVRANTHGALFDDIAGWKEMVVKHPVSRHAHLGLAKAYLASNDLTSAADEFIVASQIALKYRRIRYTKEIADVLVKLNNKKKLDEIFEKVLAQTNHPHKHRYIALVDYAYGLDRLKDDRASTYYEEAINIYPDNNTEAVNRFTKYLLGKDQPAKALEVLDKLDQIRRVWDVYPVFARKKALKMLGLDTASADEEIRMVEDNLSTAHGQGSRHGGYVASTDLAEAPLPLALSGWSHNEANDDCRVQPVNAGHCFSYVTDTFMEPCMGRCYYWFYPHTVNAAEVLYNESRSERKGAQAMVAWVIMNRAAEKPSCDAYPGGYPLSSACANLPCYPVSGCTPDNCTIDSAAGCFTSQQCQDGDTTGGCRRGSHEICCVVHGGQTDTSLSQYQFNNSHVDCDSLLASGVLWETLWTFYGKTPDISNPDWLPPYRTSCDTNCDRPFCEPRDLNVTGLNPSPKGPIEYRAYNYCAAARTCKWYSKNVCGDTTVPRNLRCNEEKYDTSMDNFFWNRAVKK